jgi:hypothetical protein
VPHDVVATMSDEAPEIVQEFRARGDDTLWLVQAIAAALAAKDRDLAEARGTITRLMVDGQKVSRECGLLERELAHLKSQDEVHWKTRKTLVKKIARLKRIECWQCGRSPQDEPSIVLTRLNPKGVRGVFACQDHPDERPSLKAALGDAERILDFNHLSDSGVDPDDPDSVGWREKHAATLASLKGEQQ